MFSVTNPNYVSQTSLSPVRFGVFSKEQRQQFYFSDALDELDQQTLLKVLAANSDYYKKTDDYVKAEFWPNKRQIEKALLKTLHTPPKDTFMPQEGTTTSLRRRAAQLLAELVQIPLYQPSPECFKELIKHFEIQKPAQ